MCKRVEEGLRRFQRRAMADAVEFDIARIGDGVGNGFVEHGWCCGIKRAANHFHRHGQCAGCGQQIRIDQQCTSGLKGIGVDFEQSLAALLNRMGMFAQISRVKHAIGSDFGYCAQPAFFHLLRHHTKGLLALFGESCSGIADHEFGNTGGIGNRISQSERATKAVTE